MPMSNLHTLESADDLIFCCVEHNGHPLVAYYITMLMQTIALLSEHTVCLTSHTIDRLTGSSAHVHKRCARPSECNSNIIGCHLDRTERVLVRKQTLYLPCQLARFVTLAIVRHVGYSSTVRIFFLTPNIGHVCAVCNIFENFSLDILSITGTDIYIVLGKISIVLAFSKCVI